MAFPISTDAAIKAWKAKADRLEGELAEKEKELEELLRVNRKLHSDLSTKIQEEKIKEKEEMFDNL